MDNKLIWIITGIVGLVVLLSILPTLISDAMGSGASLSDSSRCNDTWSGNNYVHRYNKTIMVNTSSCNYNGACTWVKNRSVMCAYTAIPLSSLFDSGGVIFVVVMAAMLLIIFYAVWKHYK
jgi:uncharacterized membrane protein